ncbi:MAG: hypothetical protein EWM47_07775 [Anaerolineaceae bacterium]|nr:MAG: hypothetical protein EWM47_07775 [Anaerolineaceae bacterium]
MYALFVVLNEIDYLEDILSGFVESKISGATILDSQGMGSAIANSDNEDIPLFSTLRMLIGDTHPYSKTIFTVLENEAMVNKAVGVIQEVVSDIETNGIGFMFSVPIAKVYPMKQD